MRKKEVTYYCDRCHAEGKGEVRAALVVWIRTSLGGRPVRLDVCGDHFALIVGQASPNGAAPPQSTTPQGERTWSKRGGGVVLEEKAYKQLLALSTKHARFSFDDAGLALGKDANSGRLGRVLTMLVADGKLERYTAGIYQRPGYSIPEPVTTELAAAAVLKIVKAQPGLKATAAAAFAGIDRTQLWRNALESLRADKLVRSKGGKSAMRLYPI